MNDCPHQGKFLAHPFGKFAQSFLPGISQSKLVEHGRNARPRLNCVYPIQAGIKFQVLICPHTRIQAMIFCQNAYGTANLICLLHHIIAADPRPAAARAQDRSEHPDRGGFPRAILAQQY